MKAINPLLLVFILFFIGCGSSDQDAEFNANDAETYLEQRKAIGHNENDLRGMWSITFEKKTNQ